MAQIKFTKMQGLGNDFLILDHEEFEKTQKTPSELAKILCNRNFSIGADGLIIVNPNVTKTDLGWIFYNSDGSIAQMCGNGMRCFAKYVFDKKIVDKKEFSVQTEAGVIVPKIVSENLITVNMSKPILETSKIPFTGESSLDFEVASKDKIFKASAVSMGNPHCVIVIDQDTKAFAKEYGAEIEVSKLFPEKTNVEFIKIISENEINLDVFERGCGITLACGTGACAAVVAGVLKGLLNNKVKVNLPGGALVIEWAGSSENTDFDVFMSGDAKYSFTGLVAV